MNNAGIGKTNKFFIARVKNKKKKHTMQAKPNKGKVKRLLLKNKRKID